MTATFSGGRDLFFAHVGHSRAYLFRDGQLMRLTRDHTIGRPRTTTRAVAPSVDVNATAKDLAHMLTDTIGMPGRRARDRSRALPTRRQGSVLVCTNGFTDMLDESGIAEVLAAARRAGESRERSSIWRRPRAVEDDVTALRREYQMRG